MRLLPCLAGVLAIIDIDRATILATASNNHPVLWRNASIIGSRLKLASNNGANRHRIGNRYLKKIRLLNTRSWDSNIDMWILIFRDNATRSTAELLRTLVVRNVRNRLQFTVVAVMSVQCSKSIEIWEYTYLLTYLLNWYDLSRLIHRQDTGFLARWWRNDAERSPKYQDMAGSTPAADLVIYVHRHFLNSFDCCY